MRLFHGTSASFDAFTLDEAARPEMASNGHLGVWLAVKDDLAERFGSRCLTVEADFQRIHSLPISALARLHNEARRIGLDASDDPDGAEKAFYVAQRTAFLEQGIDALAIIEIDNRCEIVIALRPEQLRITDVREIARARGARP